jgi:hypothetical protein
MAEGYRGVVGAVPYALRSSDSWLFRSYAIVSAAIALLVSLLFGLGLVVLVARTAAVPGGSLTLSRAFYAVVALSLLVPVLAPTLLVARRHRQGLDRTGSYDARLALAGYLFLFSLYVGLVIAAPASARSPATGTLAPAIRVLYSLPRPLGALPPLLGAALIAAAHRLG